MMFIQKIYRDHEGELVSKIANHLQGGIVSGLKLVHSSARATALQPEEGERLTQSTLSIKKEKILLNKNQPPPMRWLGSRQMGRNPNLFLKYFVVWLPLSGCVNPFFLFTSIRLYTRAFCLVTNRYTTFKMHIKSDITILYS